MAAAVVEAARTGDAESLAYLLYQYSDCLSEDQWGHAVAWATNNRRHHCLLILLGHAHAREALGTPCGGGGSTPLHLCIVNNDLATLRLLAPFGLALDVRNGAGTTARQLALTEADALLPELRQLLQQIEADDVAGRHAALQRDRSMRLIQAARTGDDGLVSLLLSLGADPTFRDQQDGTALLWAVNNRRKLAALILLAHRAAHEASVQAGRQRNSVLHLSALHNEGAMVRLLLRFASFDPLALNAEARAPRDMATGETVRLLLTPFTHAHPLGGRTPLPQQGAQCSQCRQPSIGQGARCATCPYLLCDVCRGLHDMWARFLPPSPHALHRGGAGGGRGGDREMCVMCRRTRVETTNVPCGHTFLCGDCSDQFRASHGPVCVACRQASTVQAAVTQQTCAVCMDDVDLARLFCLGGCGHMMCVSCSAGFVRGALSDVAASFPLRCPGLDPQDSARCSVAVDTTRLSLLRFLSATATSHDGDDATPPLTEDEVQRACECQDAAAIPRDQQVHCPLCNEFLFRDPALDDEDDCCGGTDAAGPRVECPKCQGAFCVECRAAWHEGLTCAAFRNPDLDRTQAFINQTSKECPFPSCRARVTHYRDHGCHHIAGRGCPGCGRHFCYVCLSEWPCRNGCGLFCNTRCGCLDCPDCSPGRPCPQCHGNCPSCRDHGI